MFFYLIRDIEEKHCNGVILESEDHRYGAMLAGEDDGVDDPARVIPHLISKNNGQVEYLTVTEGGGRKKEVVKKDEPGYIKTMLEQMQFPLTFFRMGRIKDVTIPSEMCRRLWERFADPDEKVPVYQPLN